jgi:ribosomal protein S18 acetylase RimI-like enzyme
MSEVRQLLQSGYRTTLALQGIELQPPTVSALLDVLLSQPRTVIWSGNGDASASAVSFHSEFDSSYLQRSISTIPILAATPTTTKHELIAFARSLTQGLDSQGVELSICRIPVAATLWQDALEAHGFERFGNQVFLARHVAAEEHQPAEIPSSVRPAVSRDIATLLDISHEAFRHSHYYKDTRLAFSAVNRMYEQWLRNDCEGRAAISLVVEADGSPAGYFGATFDRVLEQTAEVRRYHVDLVVIDPKHQGKGFATTLVRAGVSVAMAGFADIVTVSTQEENRSAIALYERCGFRRMGTFVTYHRWRI